MKDFTCGPFMSASQNVQEFAHGIYYSSLFDATMHEMLECERKLNDAIRENADKEYILSLETEARQHHALLQLTVGATLPYNNIDETE